MERAGRGGDADIVLHYAIADVSFWVRPGDALDEEAWRRGVTIYMPDERARLYPAALSEGAASLLPDGARPAVVFTVRVAVTGDVTLDGVERALVHSRAKLAYESVRPADLPADFAELARRIVVAEDRRGAPRVEFPEQDLAEVDGRWALRFSPRLASEDDNAGMSLATNLAVAATLLTAGSGLFRVMAQPDEAAVAGLRHAARALGLDWPRRQSLAEFQRSLSTAEPRAAAFLIAVRRAGGGASYEPYRPGVVPWHAAMAATYVARHGAAAPPRRPLRHRGRAGRRQRPSRTRRRRGGVRVRSRPPWPRREGLAHRVDAAVIDWPRPCCSRAGSATSSTPWSWTRTGRGAVVQLLDPAVLVRVIAHGVDPGDDVRIKLVAADPAARTTTFERVG